MPDRINFGRVTFRRKNSVQKAGTGKDEEVKLSTEQLPPAFLAFFLIFISFFLITQDCPAQQSAGMDFPIINRLNHNDTGFKQFISDVHENRKLLIGLRANPQAAAENLTIYQYTVLPGEEIHFLSARCNIPYSAIATLNRLSAPASLAAGMTILLPSCPGIFIPSSLDSDLEMIIGAERQNNTSAVDLRINRQGRAQNYRFIPGADFTQTERGYFLLQGFRFPLRNYRLTSSYGLRPDPFTGKQQMHRGIDLAAAEGTEVYAAADGIVEEIGYNHVYGNYIIIKHRNNWTSFYAHLQKVETALRSEVKSTTLIGRVGSTGQSTGPHLHFELRQDGRHFDPSEKLRG